jgi:hypothetical protein
VIIFASEVIGASIAAATSKETESFRNRIGVSPSVTVSKRARCREIRLVVRINTDQPIPALI